MGTSLNDYNAMSARLEKKAPHIASPRLTSPRLTLSPYLASLEQKARSGAHVHEKGALA